MALLCSHPHPHSPSSVSMASRTRQIRNGPITGLRSSGPDAPRYYSLTELNTILTDLPTAPHRSDSSGTITGGSSRNGYRSRAGGQIAPSVAYRHVPPAPRTPISILSIDPPTATSSRRPSEAPDAVTRQSRPIASSYTPTGPSSRPIQPQSVTLSPPPARMPMANCRFVYPHTSPHTFEISFVYDDTLASRYRRNGKSAPLGAKVTPKTRITLTSSKTSITNSIEAFPSLADSMPFPGRGSGRQYLDALRVEHILHAEVERMPPPVRQSQAASQSSGFFRRRTLKLKETLPATTTYNWVGITHR